MVSSATEGLGGFADVRTPSRPKKTTDNSNAVIRGFIRDGRGFGGHLLSAIEKSILERLPDRLREHVEDYMRTVLNDVYPTASTSTTYY